jgi:hypothetical protein
MHTLDELWRVRNAAAVTLGLAEDLMERTVRAASVEDLVALIEGFSPARSYGTEWTRTFEPLVERLWTWCDDAKMAALADVFRARGMPWMGVTNALSAPHGTAIRADIRHPAGARLPAFTLV